MVEHEQQRELEDLRTINLASPSYRCRCMWELVNYIYWYERRRNGQDVNEEIETFCEWPGDTDALI